MSKEEAMKLAASVLKGSQEYKRGHATFVEAVEELEEALAEHPKTRPVESDYTSQVAYTRALEAYCDGLAEQEEQFEEAVQEEQFEEAVKVLTPKERRDAGQWHCPECFTFGHQHRRGCKAAHGIKEKNA